MKVYGALDVYFHVFMTPELVGEYSGSDLVRFTPGEWFSYV
jgi:hypothetical protein